MFNSVTVGGLSFLFFSSLSEDGETEDGAVMDQILVTTLTPHCKEDLIPRISSENLMESTTVCVMDSMP